jgi:hypothetical protein
MTQDIPVAVWSGTFTVFGVEMKCHVLDNGQRIIEADSLQNFFEALEGSSNFDEGDLMAFHRWRMS